MHEQLLIENFIYKNRQERYLNLLQTKKGRVKFRKYIPHFKDINTQFCRNIKNLNTPGELHEILKSEGASDICYIISEHSDYDSLSMNLSEAIQLLLNSGIAFFLSCIPGKLVYYEGEDTNERYLLVKES
jgi:hypothetical protein